MTKILIVNNNLHMGGVQKALVNLLNEVSGDYDITLLLFYDGGELRESVPDRVKIITASGAFRYLGMSRSDARDPVELAVRNLYAGIGRVFGMDRLLKLLFPFQRMITGYDIVISFLHSGRRRVFYGGCNEFVLRCVSAKRKITFLHCDYSKIRADSPYNRKIYSQFERIIACSDGCRQAFLHVMPEYSGKTAVVKNFQCFTSIKHMAEISPVSLPEDGLNILTVARFGKEKGILRAIEAIDKLGGNYALRYFIIGDGIQFREAENMIGDLNLKGRVILLGSMDNPYGYMQAADLLLIPSVSEAAPMVIMEAACLGTPILSTETSSAQEMIAECKLGWVCENSVEGLCEGIRERLEDIVSVRNMREDLRTRLFDNREAAAQFQEYVVSK